MPDSTQSSLNAPVSRSSRVVALAVIAAMIVGGLTFLVLSFGRVSGTEFSPDSFQSRSYFFLQLPIVQWQLTPVFRDPTTGTLERRLRQDTLITVARSQRWDVVTVTAGGISSAGDALILNEYLEQQTVDGKSRWLEWTDDRPQLAKHFWPAVQRAAQAEAYELLPDLFRLAEMADEDDDPAEFGRQVRALQRRAFSELAGDYRAAEQPQRAAALEQTVAELAENSAAEISSGDDSFDGP